MPAGLVADRHLEPHHARLNRPDELKAGEDLFGHAGGLERVVERGPAPELDGKRFGRADHRGRMADEADRAAAQDNRERRVRVFDDAGEASFELVDDVVEGHDFLSLAVVFSLSSPDCVTNSLLRMKPPSTASKTGRILQAR